MKNILFTLLFLVAFLAGYSQMSNIGGTIIVENGAMLVIEGDYTSSGTGSIEIDGSVQLKGDFINNGGNIASGSTGTLTFNGTADQEIGGSNPTSFYSAVVVNKATGGVALTGANEVLYNALTLTSGKLTLNAYDLTMAAVGISASSSAYVITNNTAGELKGIVAASNVTFPVGSATTYNPVILNNAGTSDTYGVVYTGAMPGGWTGTNHAVTGNWAISEGTVGGSSLAVTPQWNGTQEQAGFTRTDCAVGVSSNNGATVTWAASGAAIGSDPYTRIGSGFTSVGTFLVGDYFFEGIDVDIDLFLAGPYNSGTGLMNTGLKTKTLIPLTDPYSLGNTVSSIPANVVDWIKVELRDKNNASTVLYTKAFFLDNTGNVIYLDGTAGAKFTGVPKDQYYIAVKHRNHLGARTASTVDLSAVSPAFSFKNNTGVFQSQTYTPQFLLAGGSNYGLYKGNVNGDAAVRKTGPSGGNDYSALLSYLGSLTQILNVYAGADINMDGDVKKTGPAGANDYSHLLQTLPGTVTQILQQIP